MSLSGTVTSSSIDARGTTGIARSGLLIRATSASSTTGSIFDPRSLSFSDALTWTQRRAHVEVRRRVPPASQSDFQFLGSTEITYNSINDFIDNRPTAVAVALDSPVFTPQQYYLIGFVQDSWRASDRLTLELGLRYDFYSVVKEADGRAKPFFVEDNDFGTDPDNFYDADKNNFSPRLSAAYQIDDKTVAARRLRPVLRPRPVRGSHPADRELHRAPPRAGGRTSRTTACRIRSPASTSATCCRFAATRTTARTNTTCSTAPACRASCRARSTSPSATPAARARTCSCAASATRSTSTTRARPAADRTARSTTRRPAASTAWSSTASRSAGCGYATYDALQISATRRFRAGFTGGLQYQYSRNKGTTQGSNEAATAQNTFDYETEYGTNPQDIPHTFNGSLVYLIPGEGLLTGGWRVGGIVNARSGVPINVAISRPDNATVNGATVTNIPGGNSRGTQRPDLVPGVDPYLKDGVRWLNPAAFTTPQPGTFGNLPRNFLRGPEFWQLDLMFSKDFRFLQHAERPGSRRDVQHHQPAELREPGGDAAERHAGRAVHRRAGRHVRLHARAAQPHGRPRHGAADADFAALLVLTDHEEHTTRARVRK